MRSLERFATAIFGVSKLERSCTSPQLSLVVEAGGVAVRVAVRVAQGRRVGAAVQARLEALSHLRT